MIQLASMACALALSASTPSSLRYKSTADEWFKSQVPASLTKLLANISPADGAAGAVVASPSRSNPDYYFSWVRDAALTMDVVVRLHEVAAQKGFTESAYKNLLKDYVQYSRKNQMTITRGGMGEPKFYVDGRAYDNDWGRPQNDGPPLRAITLMHFADLLLKEGDVDYVRTQLYDAAIPTHSVIKADLEFVAHHWRESSFDLWEEIRGDHFYTRMVQRKALLLGARLANRLNDPGAASFYLQQAHEISKSILNFWDPARGLVVPTLNRVDGVDYKNSGIDTAVLLGALHGDAGDGFFTVTDWRIQSTLEKTLTAFREEYAINHTGSSLGVAIGRYPEDRYDGNGFGGGNPWVLTTMAYAEAYYILAAHHGRENRPLQAQVFREEANKFVERVRLHAHADGSLAEQINRYSGYMTGARDLTWSYASVLTAFWASQTK